MFRPCTTREQLDVLRAATDALMVRLFSEEDVPTQITLLQSAEVELRKRILNQQLPEVQVPIYTSSRDDFKLDLFKAASTLATQLLMLQNTDKDAVLVRLFDGQEGEQQLLLLDAADRELKDKLFGPQPTGKKIELLKQAEDRLLLRLLSEEAIATQVHLLEAVDRPFLEKVFNLRSSQDQVELFINSKDDFQMTLFTVSRSKAMQLSLLDNASEEVLGQLFRGEAVEDQLSLLAAASSALLARLFSAAEFRHQIFLFSQSADSVRYRLIITSSKVLRKVLFYSNYGEQREQLYWDLPSALQIELFLCI